MTDRWTPRAASNPSACCKAGWGITRTIGLLCLLILAVLTGCRRETYIPSLEEEITALTAEAEDRPARREGGRGASAPAATLTPAIAATPTSTREPPDSTATTYTVRPGDTLLRIAIAYGTTTEALMELNGLVNPNQLGVGQVLQVSTEAAHVGPGETLIPDSELVYGPGAAAFDVAAFADAYPGYLATYAEDVSGTTLSGSEIVELVALQYSVGPRVLLTLLELRGGWLSNPVPSQDEILYPLGFQQGVYWDGLYLQLCQAANALNGGFYDWWLDEGWLVQTMDSTFIRYATSINAGTAAVQRTLAVTSPDYEGWLADLDGFSGLYREMFGDPFEYAIEPLVPPGGRTPELVLPWAEGETWYYTGGPHQGWGTVGALSALDFVTDEPSIGCTMSQKWVTAAADGPIIFSNDGMVLQDLDGDGDPGTGWVLLYMHMASPGRVERGTTVSVGDPIGHPSCEGGVSDASHLHFARRLNGVWIPADDANWPMVLSGWRALSAGEAYEGTLRREGVERTACLCWEEINAVRH